MSCSMPEAVGLSNLDSFHGQQHLSSTVKLPADKGEPHYSIMQAYVQSFCRIAV